MARFYFTVYSRQYDFLGRCVGGSDFGFWPSETLCRDFIRSMASWEDCQVNILDECRCAELVSFTGGYSRYEVARVTSDGRYPDEFKFAKKLKEAGYPQEESLHFYEESGKPNTMFGILRESGYDAPTYLDVWLWLWREKKIEIEILNDGVGLTSQIRLMGRPQFFNADPEEAIIAAIEHLVNNDLIK